MQSKTAQTLLNQTPKKPNKPVWLFLFAQKPRRTNQGAQTKAKKPRQKIKPTTQSKNQGTKVKNAKSCSKNTKKHKKTQKKQKKAKKNAKCAQNAGSKA